ncbi:hypothetical protein N657DRAFT_682470 [Parathielavia appendiculata]|uniref:Uncharacterized protein n=1 Tax=Parathielavia appendiculata TaxID=2587402 RepID=A0AAN6Z1Y5_9PEZI|nr:hypothetical protein N657DRAFT_682470 [Parathielavia appendiculata]
MSAPYVVGDSSPFLKRVLIPFWILRIIIMVVQIGLYALVIAGLGVFKNDLQRLYDEYHTNLSYSGVLAVSCVIMGIIAVCLILDIVCIVKRARRTLSPPFFLGVNIAQSVFYIANFILTMIGARNGVISIAIGVVTLVSFLGLLIYASVVFHQYRRGSLRGSYVKADNPEVHKLVASRGYPQHAYAHDYPKTAYYDVQAVSQTRKSYGGHGYPAAPQAYESYSHQGSDSGAHSSFEMGNVSSN